MEGFGMSAAIGNVAKALAAAQKNFPKVKKDTSGYGYKYATLDQCLDAVQGPLADQGLAITQILSPSNPQEIHLQTILMHTSGEWLLSDFAIPAVANKGMNQAQALGSAITYARRYALCAICGIAAEEDDDGAAAVPPVGLRQTIPPPAKTALSPVQRAMVRYAKTLDPDPKKGGAILVADMSEFFQRAETKSAGFSDEEIAEYLAVKGVKF